MNRLEQLVERLQIQLAAGSVAAAGHIASCKEGDYGWSVAYQDVLELRRKYEEVKTRIEEWEDKVEAL